ncbi:hypothetical protein D1164_22595 [Mariniphaga sediminis]|uniref:Uncharacterized protein n=1 Tax=Mariniphaga sediminis TaxID=1628158 RepID=A0A399CU48_9BACT|nr:hypothetical protein D1164_22595 [Mariniphaga sediminis]
MFWVYEGHVKRLWWIDNLFRRRNNRRLKSNSEFNGREAPAFRLKSLFLWLRKMAKHFLS